MDAGLGNRIVLRTAAAADADTAHDLAVDTNREAAAERRRLVRACREDHPHALDGVGSSALRVFRGCSLANGAVDRFGDCHVDAPDTRPIGACETHEASAGIDHGDADRNIERCGFRFGTFDQSSDAFTCENDLIANNERLVHNSDTLKHERRECLSLDACDRIAYHAESLDTSNSNVSRAAVLGAAATSLAALALPYRAGSQELTRIRVGASLDDGITPVLYGMQAGLYKRVGLEIEMLPSANGAALATAVAGGSADFAKSSTMALITAYTHGVLFKMVSGATLYQDGSPGTLLVILKDSPIKSLDDVAGKTIAVNTLRSLEMIGVRALIDQHGGNSAASKYIELPDSAMLGALQAGRVDMAAISDPALTDALKTGQVRAVAAPFSAIAKELLIACWFCSDTYAKANRDIVNRFASATRTAILYTNAHHAETVPLLAAYSHLGEDTISRMTRVQSATSLNATEIQPAIDAAVKYDLIPKAFDASELLLGS